MQIPGLTAENEELLQPSSNIAHELNLCGICVKTQANYTCPRCNLHYCSQSCYTDRVHQECSEQFYRQQIKEATQQQTKIIPGLPAPQLINDTETEYEEETIVPCGELNDQQFEELWGALTVQEQTDLIGTALRDRQFWRNPRIRQQLWQPWWQGGDPEPLLQPFQTSPATATVTTTTTTNNNCVPATIASDDWQQFIPTDGLRGLFKSSSERLKLVQPVGLLCTVVHLLFTFVYTTRLYNGQHHSVVEDDAQTVLQTILDCSTEIFASNKSTNQQQQHQQHRQHRQQQLEPSIQSTIDDFLHYSKIASDIQSLQSWLQLCADVYDLLTGAGRFTQLALMDLRQLLIECCATDDCELNATDRKSAFLARKKVEFLLVFLWDLLLKQGLAGMNLFGRCREVLRVNRDRLSEDLKAMELDKTRVRRLVKLNNDADNIQEI